MRFANFLVAALLSATTTVSLAADGKRDAGAVAEVEAAIAAMGGTNGLTGIKDSVATGTSAPVKDGQGTPASFVWKTYSTEFRYETKRDSGTRIFVSGFGKPAVSRDGDVSPVFYHVAVGAPPLHLPVLVLAARLADPSFSFTDAGNGKVGGQAAILVDTSESFSDAVAKVTQQTWYLDANSGLPLRVEVRVPEATDMSQWLDEAMEFAGYRKVGDLTIPFSMTLFEAGVASQVFTVSTVDFNVGLDPSEFDLLGGGK